MKIQDIKILVEKMNDKEYANTLWGPRTQGSTSKIGLADMDENVQLISIPGDNPECSYYQAVIPGLGGRLGATALKEVDLSKVRVRQGHHGLELFLEGGKDLNVKTEIVTFIVGPTEDGKDLELWTWHPGNSIPSANLRPEMAVKLV